MLNIIMTNTSLNTFSILMPLYKRIDTVATSVISSIAEKLTQIISTIVKYLFSILDLFKYLQNRSIYTNLTYL